MSYKYTKTICIISLKSAECELHPLAEWSLIPSSLQGPLTLTTSQTWSRLRACVWADGRRPMISLADERRWVRHPPRKPRRRRPPPAARCSQWEGDVVPAIAPRTLTATARGGGGTDPPPPPPPPPLATLLYCHRRHSPVLPPPPPPRRVGALAARRGIPSTNRADTAAHTSAPSPASAFSPPIPAARPPRPSGRRAGARPRAQHASATRKALMHRRRGGGLGPLGSRSGGGGGGARRRWFVDAPLGAMSGRRCWAPPPPCAGDGGGRNCEGRVSSASDAAPVPLSAACRSSGRGWRGGRRDGAGLGGCGCSAGGTGRRSRAAVRLARATAGVENPTAGGYKIGCRECTSSVQDPSSPSAPQHPSTLRPLPHHCHPPPFPTPSAVCLFWLRRPPTRSTRPCHVVTAVSLRRTR